LRGEVPFSLSYLARGQDFEARLALRAGIDGLIGENQSRAGYDNFAYPSDECIGDAGLARHLRDVWIVCGRFAIDSNPLRSALIVPSRECAENVQSFDLDRPHAASADLDTVAINVNHLVRFRDENRDWPTR